MPRYMAFWKKSANGRGLARAVGRERQTWARARTKLAGMSLIQPDIPPSSNG